MSGAKSVANKKGATLTLYAERGRLFVNFVVDGKRVRKSLRMDDTIKNRQMANNEIIPILQSKIIRGEYGITKEKPKTFGYYAEFFLKQKEESLQSYRSKFSMYEKVIEYFGKVSVSDITRFMIKQYIEGLKIKPNSKKIYLSTIKAVLDLAVDDCAIKTNEALNIPLGKQEQQKIDFFSREEMKKILGSCTGWYKTYLEIAFSTGMRHEEIIALKFSDINGGFVKIQRTKTLGEIREKTKTINGKRTIPFNVEVEHLKHKSFYLFPHINNVSYFKKSWRTLLKNSGVKYRSIKNTRHTFATHVLKDGIVSVNELAGLLGHAKVSTTFTYYASVIDSHDFELSEKLKRQSFVSIEKSYDAVNY